MKRVLKFYCISVLVLLSTVCVFSEDSNLDAAGVPPVQDAVRMMRDMGTGWNLGNTLDANPSIDVSTCSNLKHPLSIATETSWGMPKTTETMIKTIADAGFKTVRIPVSWSEHMSPKNYKIDAKWMNRVQEIVDWVLKYDMYAVINIHHDNFPKSTGLKSGYGYYPAYSCEDVSQRFVEEVWKQVSARFRDYGDHLVFETLNEPRLRGDPHEWNYVPSCKNCVSSMKQINALNKKALDVIRGSGGKNARRLVIVPSYVAAPWSAFEKDFVIPEDSAGMIALSVHMYSPYPFAMQKNSQGGTSVFTEQHRNELLATFRKLESDFISRGIPVFIGEYGATNKHNDSDREAWFAFFVEEATKNRGMCTVLWDNNQPNNSDESERFGFFDRENLSWYFPKIIEEIRNKSK